MPQARRAAQPPPRRGADAQPPRKRSDLLSRVLVAVPAAVLAIVFVDIGGIGWMLLMVLLAFACLNELYRMLPDWRPVPVVGFVVVAGMCVAARYGHTPAYVAGAACAGAPLVLLAIMARGHTTDATLTIAATLLGIIWIGFAFAFAVLLRQVPHVGKGIVIDVMIGTFVGDTAAYLGGRMFGRHPMAPTISPKKTVEGLGIGALATIVAVVVAGLYQEAWLSHGAALLLGVAIAIFGPLGDLFESLIKRDAGTKDAGRLFGAHGGALDRLDAIIFTIVVGYFIAIHLPAR